MISTNIPLMLGGCLLCCLDEDASIPCCLYCSCWNELVGVCWLTSLSLLGLSMISSLVPSSTWGSILCLLACGGSVDLLAGVVSSRSLFLLLSSLRVVRNAGIYGASVYNGGACPWPCSFELVGCSVIGCCFVSITSLPFVVHVVPSPTCLGSLNVTCSKESKSRVFSKYFTFFSITSSWENSSTSVPCTHSSSFEYYSISGILQWS